MNNEFSVYVLTLPNSKKYVGYIRGNPENLWTNSENLYLCTNNENLYKSNKSGLYDDIQKYSWKNVKHEIVYVVQTRDEAIEKKKELCLKYKSYLPENGYNRYCDAGLKNITYDNVETKNVDRDYMVYVHIFPDNKKYVGFTNISSATRWKDEDDYKTNIKMYDTIKQIGWENIEHMIVCEGLSKSQATQLEVNLIKLFNSDNPEYGYNNTTGEEMTSKSVHQEKIDDKSRSRQIRSKFYYKFIDCYFDHVENTVRTLCLKFTKNYEDDMLEKMISVMDSDDNNSKRIKQKNFDTIYGKISYIFAMLRNLSQ